MEKLDEFRKVLPDEIRRFPDGIKIYVVCNCDSAIDTSYFTGWYRKYANHVQNDKGFINLDNKNFDFYVKFKISLPVAQQMIFDIAMELEGGFSQLTNKEMSAKLLDIIKQIDYMSLWNRGNI